MKQSWSKEEIEALASDIANDAIDENIEANPTLEGDEETLTSIGIKGTNYAVGGGSEVHLYRHDIYLLLTSNYKSAFTIHTSSSSAFDKNSLKEYMAGKWISAITTATNKYVNGFRMTKSENHDVMIEQPEGGANHLDISSMSDTVTQIL